jgi:hypothetical protein
MRTRPSRTAGWVFAAVLCCVFSTAATHAQPSENCTGADLDGSDAVPFNQTFTPTTEDFTITDASCNPLRGAEPVTTPDFVACGRPQFDCEIDFPMCEIGLGHGLGAHPFPGPWWRLHDSRGPVCGPRRCLRDRSGDDLGYSVDRGSNLLLHLLLLSFRSGVDFNRPDQPRNGPVRRAARGADVLRSDGLASQVSSLEARGRLRCLTRLRHREPAADRDVQGVRSAWGNQ